LILNDLFKQYELRSGPAKRQRTVGGHCISSVTTIVFQLAGRSSETDFRTSV